MTFLCVHHVIVCWRPDNYMVVSNLLSGDRQIKSISLLAPTGFRIRLRRRIYACIYCIRTKFSDYIGLCSQMTHFMLLIYRAKIKRYRDALEANNMQKDRGKDQSHSRQSVRGHER